MVCTSRERSGNKRPGLFPRNTPPAHATSRENATSRHVAETRATPRRTPWRFKSSHPHQRFSAALGTLGEQTVPNELFKNHFRLFDAARLLGVAAGDFQDAAEAEKIPLRGWGYEHHEIRRIAGRLVATLGDERATRRVAAGIKLLREVEDGGVSKKDVWKHAKALDERFQSEAV